jgi:hypothetical protein
MKPKLSAVDLAAGIFSCEIVQRTIGRNGLLDFCVLAQQPVSALEKEFAPNVQLYEVP